MKDKPLLWLHGEIRTPPLSSSARVDAGYLLRQIQSGLKLSLPHSRPLPTIAPGCHEIRIVDATKIWRIAYFVDRDAVVILDVFEKKTQKTPRTVIENCKRRLQLYKASAGG
jgi:phage-related protein